MSRVAPYKLRTWSLVLFFVLLALFGGVALGAYYPEFRVAALDTLIADFSSHASNLGLSFMIVVIYGTIRMVYCPAMRELVIATAGVVSANYTYELFLPFWNTPDLIDAHYGLIGSLVALAYLIAVRTRGLKPNPQQT
jgi:hypothetical protein